MRNSKTAQDSAPSARIISLSVERKERKKLAAPAEPSRFLDRVSWDELQLLTCIRSNNPREALRWLECRYGRASMCDVAASSKSEKSKLPRASKRTSALKGESHV